MAFNFITFFLKNYIETFLKCFSEFTLLSVRSNGAPSFLLHQSALAPRNGMGSEPAAAVFEKIDEILVRLLM